MKARLTTSLVFAAILLSPCSGAEESSIIEEALDPRQPANQKTDTTRNWETYKKPAAPAVTRSAAPPARTGSESDSEIQPQTQALPIHSELPASVRRIPVLNIPYGDTKVGKSHSVDPTYRGKPALPDLPSVSSGTPSWAIPKKKLSSATPNTSNVMPPLSTPLRMPAESSLPPASKPTSESSQINKFTLNVRFKTGSSMERPADSIWAYPYPAKPPKQVAVNPLPTDEQSLKQMILSTGYSFRPDLSRPFPFGGWRWIHAFQTAQKKAALSVPHTMITMYPWTNKMFPYVLAECHELNKVEEERSARFQQMKENYERVHADLEAQAIGKGLAPVEIKVNSRGIGQTSLPAGNWWITATRKTATLKFYWQIPISAAAAAGSEQTINVQFTEANALIVAGGW